MAATVHRAYPITQLACIVNLLHRLATNFPQKERPSGMTISQLSVLGFLSFHQDQDIYQRDVENFFKLRRSTISSLLNTLERKQLIRRTPVSHDARLKKLELTEQGHQSSYYVYHTFSQMNDLMIQGLSPEEVQTLVTILGKIEDNLTCAES